MTTPIESAITLLTEAGYTIKPPSGAKRAKPATAIITDWIPAEAWAGYLEMRREKKKAPTARAVELILNNLGNLLGAGQDIAAVLDQSTLHGWTAVYAVKQQGGRFDRQSPQDANAAAKRALFGFDEFGVIDEAR